MPWKKILLQWRNAQRLEREWKQTCRVCGAPVERHAFVCDEEACQMAALGEQAMLAVTPTRTVLPPRRTAIRRPGVGDVSLEALRELTAR